MATVSHQAFRMVTERFGGCDEYYTEMIHAPSLLNGGPFEKYYVLSGPVPEKIVWQLTGSRPDPIIQAAELVARLGGIGVDLNMGCSAPDIYKTGAGIAWMLKPREQARELVRGVRSVLQAAACARAEDAHGGSMHDGTAPGAPKPLRLSVKCRLGDEDFTDESFFSFTDMLVQEGVQRIALHPRTRREKYRALPRWQYVQQLADRYSRDGVQVVLNGAVQDTASALRAMAAAPSCAGIMIGRAAVQKPWVFAEIQAGLAAASAIPAETGNDMPCGFTVNLYDTALAFLDALKLYQPPEFWKSRWQRFFAYYCDNFSFAHYIKTRLLNAACIENVYSLLSEYFEKVPEDRERTVRV